jgi:hypothetical protein
MANPYEMFKTNANAEVERGIDLDYGDFKIRIVRAGGANKKFSQLLTAKMRPYRRQIDNDTLDPAVADRLMAEVYADTIILGWDGVCGEDGKPLSFSKENVVKILTDLPDMFRDIQSQAMLAANFKIEERKEDAKNSSTP